MDNEELDISAVINSRDNNLPRISTFSGEGEDLYTWIERFEQIMNAMNMKDKDMFVRMPVYFEGVAKSWYFSRAKPDRTNAPKDYKELKQALTKAFLPSDYRSRLQRQFRTKTQRQNQSVRTYIYEMIELACRIDPKAPDDVVICAIKEGLLPGIEMFLNILPHDGMENFVENCQRAEKSYQASMKASRTSTLDRPGVNAVIICSYCNKRGHKEEQCYKKQRQNRKNQPAHSGEKPNVATVVQEVNWGDAWAMTVTSNKKANKLITAKVMVGQVELDALIDTGAEISIVKAFSLQNTGIQIKPYTGPPTYVADRRQFHALGECTAQFTLMTETRPVKIISKLMVVKELPCQFDFIVGQDVLRAMGGTIDLSKNTLLAPDKELSTSSSESSEEDDTSSDEDILSKRLEISNVITDNQLISRKDLNLPDNIDNESSDKLISLSNKYKDIFAFKDEDIKESNICKHVIDTGEAKPIYQQPYRQSLEKQTMARKMIQQLLQLKIVRPSKSPWSSPIVLVPKKTGDVRMAIDYRKINTVTKPDRHPLPDIGLALDSLQGTTVYTSLDLRQGYYQIAMEEKDKEKTAFITLEGLYEFNRMPFGLTNAPATFQRMMNLILDGILFKFTMVYLDDILIYSKNMEDHLKHIEEVFRRLKNASLTIKPSKCDFLQSSILFLGYIIDKDGQRPDPNKVKAIKEIPPPTDLTLLRRFIGMASFYRKFIENFAKIAEPLHRLTKKEQPFKWGTEQQIAFEQLKRRLISHPVLRHYKPDDNTQVRCDASDIGISAIILQEDSSGFRPVAYASRLLRGSELNYTIADRECLAIIFAVQKFRPYLEGIEFEIITDNCALCFLQSKNKLPPRLMRYSMLLQEFHFKIKYKSGKTHLDADALSRLFPTHSDVQQPETLKLLSREEPFADENWISFISQQTDSYCLEIIDQLTKVSKLPRRQRKQLRKFLYENGALYRLAKTPYGVQKLLVAPKANRLEIIRIYHDSSVGGHFGVQKTIQNIRSKYFWKTLAKDVAEYIQDCEACQLTKDEMNLPRGELQPIHVQRPFHKIGLDFVGPLTQSKLGNHYILVCTDLFTRWAEAKATYNCTAKTVAEFLLYDIFMRHGSAEEIISDRGRAFISKTLGILIKMMNSKHILTTAYHPMTNGATERVNQTLCQILSTLVYKKTDQWDILLPMATFAYNCSINNSTRNSPFFLIYGRLPRLFESIKIHQRDFADMNEYVNHVKHQWPQIKEIAAELSFEAKNKTKDEHDLHRRCEEFHVGGEVLLRKLPLRDKVGARFEGPYKIIEKKSPINYIIQRKNKQENIHIERLKPYKRSTGNIISLILLVILMIPYSLSIFNTVPPIIWRKQMKSVSKGQYDIQMRIYLENPCLHLLGNQSHFLSKRYAVEDNYCGDVLRPYGNGYIKIGNRMSYPTEDFCISHPDECNIIHKYLQVDNSMQNFESDLIEKTWESLKKQSPPIFANQTWHEFPGDGKKSLWETSFEKVLMPIGPYTFINHKGRTWVQVKKYKKDSSYNYFEDEPRGFRLTTYTLRYNLTFKDREDVVLVAKQTILKRYNEECEKSYKNTFMEPLKTLCQTTKRKRTKRIIPVFAFVAGMAIPGIISMGLGVVNTLLSIQKAKDIEELKGQAKSLIQRDETIRSAITALQSNIYLLADKSYELESRLTTLEQILPELTFTSGLLINKLINFKHIFKSLRTSPTNPTLLQNFLTEFNLTLPCGKNCPLKMARTLYCEISDDILDVFLSISGVDPKKLVVQADAFSPHTKNSTHTCIEEYKGPEHMIIDTDTGNKCRLTPYEEGQLKRSDTDLLTFSGLIPNSCETNELSKTENLWQKKECVTANDSSLYFPQIKFTGDSVYVYCFGSNITLFDKTLECPNSAFKMSPSANFSVPGYTHNVEKVVIEGNNIFEASEMLNYIANLAVTQSKPLTLQPVELPELVIEKSEFDFFSIFQLPSIPIVAIVIGTLLALYILFRIVFAIMSNIWKVCCSKSIRGTNNKGTTYFF